MTAAERMVRARTALLFDHPWFGALALRLRVVENADMPAPLRVDGTTLEYNPLELAPRTDAELRTGIAHEVLHCALLHPYRGGGRDWQTWNRACDYAINQLLADQGFPCWPGWLLDAQYAGMTAEQVYGRLREQDQDGGAGNGQDGDSGPSQPDMAPGAGDGENRPDSAPGPAAEAMTAEDWQIAAEQAAMVGRKAGTMPGAVDRAIVAQRRPAADWRAILREFVEQAIPSDYSWLTPSRAYLGTGLYLPGVLRDNCPVIAVGIDTSGSIGPALLAAFGRELTAILHEARPERLDVVYCDAEVQAVESFDPDDPAVELHAAGGGGTEFQPVFDHVAAAGELPACLVYFTDLEGPAPRDPGYPVLWVTPESSGLVGPFGQTVRVAA